MCGICGQFNFGHDENVSRHVLERMTRSIAHRGPDDEGYFEAGPIGLGFRRLSIIDLSGGHQPMSDAEATVWVAFNGEIYNFKELRNYPIPLYCDEESLLNRTDSPSLKVVMPNNPTSI